MLSTSRRFAVAPCLRTRFSRCAFFVSVLSLFATPADAVIVRGRVTDALGKPVPAGRVQLVQSGSVVASIYADANGSYEIRYGAAGRFSLLGSAAGFLPGIGQDFYGRSTDVVEQDVVLAANTVRQEISVSATGLPTPLPQLTAPVTVLPEEAFSGELGVIDAMRQTPGAFLVQSGQTGSVTSLFLRGGSSTANLVTIDGIPALDVGGIFDYGTVSSTAVGQVEMYRGPNSAIYGTDAGAGVIAINTPRGTTATPLLTYTGEAGNLHTWRNEATVGGTHGRFDFFGALLRLDTSNALQYDRYHATTSAANVGYNANANTQMRFTIRNADSVEGLPGAHDFYGLSSNGREGDQDIYSGITLENRYKGNWHNLLRYGIARKREQAQQFAPVGTPVVYNFGYGPFTEYYGNKVTIRGANGYKVTGQASFFNPNYDQDSNRDQLYYQSDYIVSPHFTALFGLRYDKERGSFNDNDYAEHRSVQRTNFEYNLQFQGEFWNRLFYSAGGSIEKNHLYGVAGTPKIGLAYVPVRSSSGLFRGTRFRANAATGVQEPTLALEYAGLYRQLTAAQIATLHVPQESAERSRTYDLGIDQNVIGEKLVIKAGYFHNVFDHQLEGVSSTYLQNVLKINVPSSLYEAYVNSLAYRAQGEEVELVWQPRPRLLVRGGYTHLDAKVVQSFSTDVENATFGPVNPAFPNTAIGAEGPLVGGRPFRRAPNTGYANVLYSRPKFSLMAKAAMASRADDSTFLDGEDVNFGNSLLLPNRDLDFGYVKLDFGGTYAVRRQANLFVVIENALNNQHIGPIGYPGLPLTFRAGVKIRLGGGD